MKKSIRNYSVFAIALLAFTLAFSGKTFANDEEGKGRATELKFIGNVENQPVFQLDINNSDDEFVVTFRDDAGNVLYSDIFKGTGVTKRFQLKGDGISDAAVNVVVRSKKNNTVEVYTISKTNGYVTETVVNKIK